MKKFGFICWIGILAGCTSQRAALVSCGSRLQAINVAEISAVAADSTLDEKKPGGVP